MKFAIFILLLCCISTPVLACEPTAAEFAQELKASRELEEQFALRVAKEADFIAIGRAVNVSDVDESTGYYYRVHFDVERVLKGEHRKTTSALKNKIETRPVDEIIEEIYVCGQPVEPRIDDADAVKTYKYLFYIKNDILLRTSTYPEAPFPMRPQEEIDLLIREEHVASY
ncbi:MULTISPECIES: hypothetical protein [Pseudoalteromonas]|uniref:Uncharacterized protein n=1 Tax=Pseudoalteromonas luteoviolacea (strain 2ta16) TaxID=1353533 RepID=V4H1X9_PSEL2|nr:MULTISPECIES: hypothetical protein [Pseudoalteromonas]ESP91436.1 hypothetical protein PL2TA16_00235 [Pseudoalteromonas luteoviolacea 2ta16]KZN40085.1 hypothetical protein N483_18020 [Pseudoalteromonas luteoviolacea NCIMB 1944]MCG7551558.1 hypothetical protein [Pseudoalteromonas sp. Of7M-16]